MKIRCNFGAQVRLFHPIKGVWQTVKVYNEFPLTADGQHAFARPSGNEAWVLVLEKAIAKLLGGYRSIGAGGHPSYAFWIFTGAWGYGHVVLIAHKDHGTSTDVWPNIHPLKENCSTSTVCSLLHALNHVKAFSLEHFCVVCPLRSNLLCSPCQQELHVCSIQSVNLSPRFLLMQQLVAPCNLPSGSYMLIANVFLNSCSV